jgi:hypothetical protein
MGFIVGGGSWFDDGAAVGGWRRSSFGRRGMSIAAQPTHNDTQE